MSSPQQQLEPGERVLLLHYGELGLKGDNRGRFERLLRENIEDRLRAELDREVNVLRLEGRFVVQVPEADLDRASEVLTKIPGIVYFSVANVVNTDLDRMKEVGLQTAKAASFDEFSVRARRPYKGFAHNSRKINEELGQIIVDELQKDVDLDDPDWTLWLEVMQDRTFIYDQKIRGVGGLPVGVSGPVLTLLSGGIDSPVASYLMMKRGSPNGFIHFHSFPLTDRGGQEKVKELRQKLDQFQGESTLYMVPFADCQQEIVAEAPAEYRIILYRRFMVRIAERIAEGKEYMSLVTGENLGQVSSQTMSNMRSIEDAINMPILRPLLGYDKNDIAALARKIDTYDISIQPHEDCCSYLMPQQPATGSRIPDLKRAEQNLDVDALVEETVDNITVEGSASPVR
jgi:thiamine biosynthesis protein ThiI